MPDSLFTSRLHHCQQLERQLTHASAAQRRATGEQINAEIQRNVGLFDFALPMIISMLMLIVSFSLVLLPVVEALAQWLGLSARLTLVTAGAGTLLFASINVLSIWFISKGFMAAVRIQRGLMRLSLLTALLSLVKSLADLFTGLPHSTSGILCALVAGALIGGCVAIMRSRRFMDGLLFSLYCRAMRMQIVADSKRH